MTVVSNGCSSHLNLAPELVVVTGLHSGPNPSPGVGVARSLKSRWPGLRLVGIDYSPECSGMHSSHFDEVIEFPSWVEMDVKVWAEQITALLDGQDSALIPGLDLEVRLLAERLGGDPRLLVPARAALEFVRKPAVEAGRALGMPVPSHCSGGGEAEIGRFLRSAKSGAWAKGQHYEAFRVHSPANATRTGSAIEATWGGPWHLEENVSGQEASIAFAARDGVLIDAVFMTKAQLTAEGKTWSGSIEEVGDALHSRVAQFVGESGWCGGGELEMVREWNGRLHLLEINPRFPAWIHGATICGYNLPAALLSGCRERSSSTSSGFTRIVEEIPISATIGLPPHRWTPAVRPKFASKHPSGMPIVGQRRLSTSFVAAHPTPNQDPNEIDLAQLHDLDQLLITETPQIVFTHDVLRQRLVDLSSALDCVGEFSIAYSVKTAPHPGLMRLAASLGLRAEVISQDELKAAERCGFEPAGAILNGPAKWWPHSDEVSCRAFFTDSIDELRWLLEGQGPKELRSEIVGVRLAPTGGGSRFGVRLESPRQVNESATHIHEMQARLDAQWGVHFHLAQSTIGTHRWVAQLVAKLREAESLAEAIGSEPSMIDLGGGWHADDLNTLPSAIDEVLRQAPTWVSGTDIEWVLEPGKLLLQPVGVLLCQVIGRRGDDLVVDGSIADAPETEFWAHPVAVRSGGSWTHPSVGQSQLLGRSCMENDVLVRDLDLGLAEVGDIVAIGDCGAYDTSMAYPFGRGTFHGEATG